MKPATAKDKGRETENRFVDYLKGWVPHVERRRLNGVFDRGDIAGMPGWTWEVKSGAKVTIAGWLAELAAEMRNNNDDMGAVVVRPKNLPRCENWYAVVPLPVLMRLLEQAGWVPQQDGSYEPNVTAELARLRAENEQLTRSVVGLRDTADRYYEITAAIEGAA